MTNDNIVSFYHEIYQVCKKYKMGCFTGIWFTGRNNDEYGLYQSYDLTDTDMKMIGEHLNEKFEQWKKEILKGQPMPPSLGEIRKIPQEKRDQN